MNMNIADTIKSKYGSVATQAARGAKAPCCGGESSCNPVTSDLYSSKETSALPVEAVLASQGCGNPTALAELKPGEVVLDLGSGGGIDVLLSARRVGPSGKAYGLDMTDEMLALARENQRKAGVENVEFLRGEIESIPLPDNSVDVVISNCVINLSADKRRVLAETFRVLKPGGRFAVSDIVRRRALPESVMRSVEMWAGCVSGALEENEYRSLLAEVGFRDVGVEPTRIYRAEDARQLMEEAAGIDFDEIDGALMSAFVRATK
jgi:SAM-dependent methyltransferase